MPKPLPSVGFEKGDSLNLPEIDYFVVVNYIKSNSDFGGVEVKGVKASR